MHYSRRAVREPERNTPRSPEATLFETLAALAEKRSTLLREEAQLWTDASRALADLAAGKAQVPPVLQTAPSNPDRVHKNVLTMTETAEFLGISRSTLNKWRVIGGGPEFVRLGSRILYRMEELDKFLAKRSYPHTSAHGRREE